MTYNIYRRTMFSCAFRPSPCPCAAHRIAHASGEVLAVEHRVGLVYDLDRRPRAILPPAPLPSPVLLARGIRTKKGDGSYRNHTGSVAVFCLICAALVLLGLLPWLVWCFTANTAQVHKVQHCTRRRASWRLTVYTKKGDA